jgi:SAM-dependent methyltransferase
MKRHPLDGFYCVDTSSTISPDRITSGDKATAPSNVGYVGSQPSVVRRSLEVLPDIAGAHFIDLGCGKGRACVIATEYGFDRVIGIEFGARLAGLASRNARIMRERFPSRPSIEIRIGDATCFEPPAGQEMLVIFLYNPFGELLVKALLAHLEAMIAGGRRMFVVYYNPVQFAVFDGSASFERYFAARYDLTPDERKAAPFGDGYESVIIYQARGPAMTAPLPGADRRAVVTLPHLGAVVEN